MTAKLLKFDKHFLNSTTDTELIVKYNIGLKALLKQGISESIFYGDLVYKFKRIVEKPNYSNNFKKIIKCYKKVGYNLETVCMPGFKPNHGS